MSKIYDYAGAMRRMGDDVLLFREMVELLHKDAPVHQELARRAVREGDKELLERAAHTMKGLAANFGAARAVEAAAELERLARVHGHSGASSAMAKVERAFEELLAALPVEQEIGPMR
jgi:two-component system, sensor histidine kinase and response regulator